MRNTASDDDKLVISRANDTINLSQKRCCACYYGFLNEHEQALITENVRSDDTCMFFGGYNGAIRTMFAAGVDDTASFPITAAIFTYKKEYKLSHRDFLGALMALKIDRSTVGDIIVGDGETIVFLKSEIFDFVCNEITKIGSVGVKISRYNSEKFEYTPEFDELCFTLSSLRLDVFVSGVCSVSREKSQRMIKLDLVSVNHAVQSDPSKNISAGDIITIRKYGKFVFTESNGYSKKGKIRISVKHFR